MKLINKKTGGLANYYANYCRNIYDGYAANRENIKNPEILEFMKDYEEYYMVKEK